MSVQQLRPPVLTDRVEAAHGAVEEAAAVPLSSLQSWQVGQVLADVAALESRVAALKLSLLAEADRRRLADETAATDTSAWAARLTSSSRAVMAGGLYLARRLEETYHHTRDAFARGRLSVDQVRVIVRAGDKLPEAVTDAQRAEAEKDLVEDAVAGLDPKRLRRRARRMLERISKELADEHEADQLEEEEKRAEVETWLTLHDNGDGTFSGRFTIPELHGHLLRDALERLSAPRRLSRNKAGQVVTDPTINTMAQSLNWSERLGAAFAELLEHLPTTGHGPVGATLLVRIDHQRLVDKLGAAGLDTGADISASEARRLGCGAGIVPVVLGGASEPLDVGRMRRLHTESQRRALSLKHDTCATEGCERPFAWCEIHHPHAWSAGGRTSVDNGLPLCWHHHRRAHDARYRMRILASGEARFRRRT